MRRGDKIHQRPPPSLVKSLLPLQDPLEINTSKLRTVVNPDTEWIIPLGPVEKIQ